MIYPRAPHRSLSVEEYLSRESSAGPFRHEFVAGELFPVVATTTRHNLIVQNTSRRLHTLARPRGCRVFAEMVLVRAADDRFYYPGIMSACGAAGEVELVVEAPWLIAEVTSSGTRALARREKLDAYKRIPSLGVYLIIDQRRRHVLRYLRSPENDWSCVELSGEGTIELPFVAGSITLDEIYEDVPLPPLGVKEGEQPQGFWAEWTDYESDR